MATKSLNLLHLQRFALATLVPLAVALAWPTLSHAGDGHDHGESSATPAAAALPRFVATSDAFELVGIVNDKQLTLYLDHAPTNSPVKDAKLTLDIGGAKVAVTAQGDGEFIATLSQPMKPGVTPVTASVMAGGEADLLAGEIDIHADVHQDDHAGAWKVRAVWAGGALLVLAGVTALVRRARSGARRDFGGEA